MSHLDMPVYCARCGTLTHDIEPVYYGLDAFGRAKYGLECPTCRAPKPPRDSR
jgi:hypothetical protein